MKLFKSKNKPAGRTLEPRTKNFNSNEYYRAPVAAKSSGDTVTKKRIAGPLMIAALVCIFIAFAYNLIISPTPEITLNSEVYRTKPEYQTKLQEVLNSPLNRIKLTLNTAKVEDELKSAFPEVNGVNLTVPLMGRQPAAIISVAEPKILLVSQQNKFVVDRQGRAVVKNTTGDTSGLIRLNDQTGFEVKLSEQVLTTEEVSFLMYLGEQASKNGINVKEFVLPAGVPSEAYMYLADKPYFVKFYLGGSADQQLGSYLAAVQELAEKGTVPASYIDVRVEEKVFIK